MNFGEGIALGVSIGLIVGSSVALIFFLGEALASWRRITKERRWQAWKRKNLRVSSGRTRWR